MLKRLFILLLVVLVNLAGATITMASVSLPSIADLAQKDAPAVVNIATTKKVHVQENMRRFFEQFHRHGDPFEQFFQQFENQFGPQGQGGEVKQEHALGSGFFISGDGYIVTNYHVVSLADEVKVRLKGDTMSMSAKVVGSDQETDLALLKIEGKSNLPYLEFGDSDKLRVGDWVVAIGNPFGLESTVTLGIVSAKGRVIGDGALDDFIQTDASINPGNSGGPLIDLNGNVIGINTAIVSSGQGIGFAIPSNLAKNVISQLRQGKTIQRGWIGVSIQNLDENTAKALGMENTNGALVASVMKGQPADKAGIQSGDVIIAVNGQNIENSSALLRNIASLAPGDKAELTILRKGATQTVTVTLGKRESKLLSQQMSGGGEEENGPGQPSVVLGMGMRPITEQDAKALEMEKPHGLLVVSVADGSKAEEAGIRPGDVIVEVNQQAVNTTEELKKIATEQGKKRGVVLLLINRKGQNIFKTIPVKEGS